MFDIMIELGIYKYFIFCLGMSILLLVMYFGLLGLINMSKQDQEHLRQIREEKRRELLDSLSIDVGEITGQNKSARQNEITHRLNKL